ncbi:hypothetical protein KOEU_23950 [Komagataeibacter europaeus]|uniref:Uncharacterized protein n=1 Tax=Komagataeibacter europaeus TaxID=33995 RepID=A0A0M0EFK9_KOMEU|nr:hypothetical protein KOEU_23950 [Komagataeibacter europaeus]
MTQTEPGGIVPANDNGPVDRNARARVNALVFTRARLGRQIAREEFAGRKHGQDASYTLPLPGLVPGGKDRPGKRRVNDPCSSLSPLFCPTTRMWP